MSPEATSQLLRFFATSSNLAPNLRPFRWLAYNETNACDRNDARGANFQMHKGLSTFPAVLGGVDFFLPFAECVEYRLQQLLHLM